MGTVDSYLVARMTRGLHHVTDPSNASRTLLYDLHTGDWSPELLEPVRRAPPGPARHRLLVRGHRAHRPVVLPGPGPADRRDPRRPAGRPVRPGMLHRGLEQVHLRHGVVRPGQHRRGDRRLALGPADHRGLAAPRRPPRVRPRGGGVRHRGGGAVAARRAADHHLGRRDRGAGPLGPRLRRGRVRPGADRPRGPGLGPVRPRHDHGHHPRAPPGPTSCAPRWRPSPSRCATSWT